MGKTKNLILFVQVLFADRDSDYIMIRKIPSFRGDIMQLPMYKRSIPKYVNWSQVYKSIVKETYCLVRIS